MSDCRKCADFEWCVKNEDCGLFKPKPQTNADSIRSMTDEELAEFLNINVLAEISGEWKNWLDWLKQEDAG